MQEAQENAQMRVKKKIKIKINNKMRAYGSYDEKTRTLEVNKKKHKGDKKELADTVKHELLHVKHPKMTEKMTYKKTKAAVKKMSVAEQDALVAKLRHKKLNYKTGAIKRKYKIKASDKVEPGSLITKLNESKLSRTERVAISGLV